MRTLYDNLNTALLSILLILVCGHFAYDFFLEVEVKEVREVVQIVRVEEPYYERMLINERIKEMQKYGGYDKVLEVYGGVARNYDIGVLLLTTALTHEVPINIAFGLCRQESNFRPNAINENIKDGKVRSRDHGLMQLNDRRFGSYYRKYGKEWIIDSQNNIFLGIKELRRLYDDTGSWDLAIIKYNGRFSKGADEHLVNVYGWEREYDKLFNQEFD